MLDSTPFVVRFKELVDLMKRGDRASVAEVVVRLHRLEHERTLSGGEDRLLARAERLLGEQPDDGLASDRAPRSPVPPSLSAGAAVEEPRPS